MSWAAAVMGRRKPASFAAVVAKPGRIKGILSQALLTVSSAPVVSGAALVCILELLLCNVVILCAVICDDILLYTVVTPHFCSCKLIQPTVLCRTL